MTIRPAVAGDAEAVARGEWATAATPGLLVGRPGEIPLAAYAEKITALAPLGSYWVAEEGGAVVGHAFLEPMRMAGNAHVFQLTIVVHPGFTGLGIGTALMQQMLDWARAHPALSKIELLVRAENLRAVALYRKFGFVEEGRLRRRVQTVGGRFLDDLVMGWMPQRDSGR